MSKTYDDCELCHGFRDEVDLPEPYNGTTEIECPLCAMRSRAEMAEAARDAFLSRGKRAEKERDAARDLSKSLELQLSIANDTTEERDTWARAWKFSCKRFWKWLRYFEKYPQFADEDIRRNLHGEEKALTKKRAE